MFLLATLMLGIGVCSAATESSAATSAAAGAAAGAGAGTGGGSGSESAPPVGISGSLARLSGNVNCATIVTTEDGQEIKITSKVFLESIISEILPLHGSLPQENEKHFCNSVTVKHIVMGMQLVAIEKIESHTTSLELRESDVIKKARLAFDTPSDASEQVAKASDSGFKFSKEWTVTYQAPMNINGTPVIPECTSKTNIKEPQPTIMNFIMALHLSAAENFPSHDEGGVQTDDSFVYSDIYKDSLSSNLKERLHVQSERIELFYGNRINRFMTG